MREQKEKKGITMDFESIYHGEAPWDIGHPQKEYIQLEQAGEIVGSVLDVGCGTGENALYLAEHGHDVWGIDFAPTAIERAQEKAAQRHLTATFRVLNVLELHTLGRTFDTVIDSGLFHTLSDEDRPRFVDNLAAVMDRGGTYLMLCVSELAPLPDFSKLKEVMSDFSKFFPDPSKLKPEDYRRPQVTQAEIRASFRDGWRINYIRQATLESYWGTLNRMEPSETPGWLSSISKE
jgi:cyclopropane fatty-acyl-phospholipid synthase-like methyltransferase